MDKTKLQMFVTLAETLHFHQAAERCNISASTLSRNIQHLEYELNTTLFVRDNRSVSITSTGEQLLAFSRDILQQWDTLKDSIQDNKKHLTGCLSLYCSVTASYSFLYDILADFRKNQPSIEIQLHTGDPALAIERVNSGLEDIAIAAKTSTLSSNVSFKRICYSPLLLIQPRTVDWNLPSPNDTESYWRSVPFILPERGVTRDRLRDWFRSRRISPNVYAQVAGHEAIVSMVSLGFGIGLVPEIVLENSPLADKVVIHPCQLPLDPYEVGLCVLNKRLKSPIIKAFWEQIE